MKWIFRNGSVWATLSAMTVLLVAGVAASGGSSSVEVRGGSTNTSTVVGSNPTRCGAGFVELFLTDVGSDTLGGTFEVVASFCFGPAGPDTNQIFDYQGTYTYLQTDEQATLKLDDWIELRASEPACVLVPEHPVEFTVDGFTGEHAGGRLEGRVDYVNDARACSGLEDIPSISWLEAVFTPDAPKVKKAKKAKKTKKMKKTKSK